MAWLPEEPPGEPDDALEAEPWLVELPDGGLPAEDDAYCAAAGSARKRTRESKPAEVFMAGATSRIDSTSIRMAKSAERMRR